MKLRIRSLITITLTILCVSPAFSQMGSGNTGTPMRLGAFWDYNINQQRVGFSALPGVGNCCPEFEDAVGTGITAGILFDVHVDPLWMLSFRLSYGTHDATITDTEGLYIQTEGKVQSASIRHAIDSKLSSIDFDFLAGYSLYAGLRLHAGARLGHYVLAEYEQNESLIEPLRYGTFENGRRIRNEQSGEISDVQSLAASLLGGISYHLPLNKSGTVVFAPEFHYVLNLTSVVDGLDWNTDAYHIGIAIKFSLGGATEQLTLPGDPELAAADQNPATGPVNISQPHTEADVRTAVVPESEPRENPEPATGQDDPFPHGQQYGEEPEEDFQEDPEPAPVVEEKIPEPIVPEKAEPESVETPVAPQLTVPLSAVDQVSIDTRGLDDIGSDLPIASIEAEEFAMTNVVTLLNYIFFHDASSEIPSRYNQLEAAATSMFNMSSIHQSDKLNVHHNVLNVIGLRMQEYPDAVLSIIGCNADAGEEEGRLDLSRRRAESVRNYMRKVWNIAEQRLMIISRNLPENPSSSDDLQSVDENRRVELYSDTWEILRPMVWSKNEWKPTPPAVRFVLPRIESKGIIRWHFTVTQKNNLLKEFTGTTKIPEMLDWNIAREQPFVSTVTEDLEYVLRISSGTGQQVSSNVGSLPIQLTTIQDKRIANTEDYEYTTYHLILFEEEEQQKADYQAKVIDMVTSLFGTEAKITVKDAYSETSSKEGFADSSLRLDVNDSVLKSGLPEARFYRRAIKVFVETPAVRE
jgi:outer membrane protein OmpA-like peptidoglycan-associated protein